MEIPIAKILTEAAAKETFSLLIKNAYSEVRKIISERKGVKLITKIGEMEDALIDEINRNFVWVNNDLFANHIGDQAIQNRFVLLDLLLSPRRNHIAKSELLIKKPLKELLKETKGNIAIIGQPGSGKTTSVKFIASSILLDPDFLIEQYSFPLVIRLRELNENHSLLGELQNGGIFQKISHTLNIKFSVDVGEDKTINIELEKRKLVSRLVPKVLDELKVLLLLDGFDEIGDERIRSLVTEELKELNRCLKNVIFIITSRTSDYKLLMENTSIYELAEFNDFQIQEFSKKWFEDVKIADEFLSELFKKTPHKDFYRRPLLLQQIASIYSKSKEIPDKPKLIYKHIVNLVLQEWNEIQGIKKMSKYSSFSVERKSEFLTALAFYLTIRYNRSVFTREELRIVYVEIAPKFSLLEDQVEFVVSEIESHNGIVLKSGNDAYEFSHLTIQEYLAADYIARGGSVRLTVEDLLKIPNELAVAISLSSEPSFFLYDLFVDKILKKNLNYDFLTIFLSRLELEKPDFGSEAILGICLLSVYKKFVDKEHRTKNPDQQKIIFEEYIKNNGLIKTINSIQNLYIVVNRKFRPKYSTNYYIELKKKREVSDEIVKFNFPRTLYLKENWIN